MANSGSWLMGNQRKNMISNLHQVTKRVQQI